LITMNLNIPLNSTEHLTPNFVAACLFLQHVSHPCVSPCQGGPRPQTSRQDIHWPGPTESKAHLSELTFKRKHEHSSMYHSMQDYIPIMIVLYCSCILIFMIVLYCSCIFILKYSDSVFYKVYSKIMKPVHKRLTKTPGPTP